MPSINKVVIVGHAGRDAEISVTSSGKKIMTIPVATGNKDNTEWHVARQWEPPDWLDVRKGDLVFVEGKIKYETWESNGQKRYKAVIVGHIYNISGKSKPAEDVPF